MGLVVTACSHLGSHWVFLVDLDCTDLFGVLFLALGSVLLDSFHSGDCVHLSEASTSTVLVVKPHVVMKDAAVHVQFIPAFPPLFQPLLPPAFWPALFPMLRADVVMSGIPPGTSIHHSPVALACSARVRRVYLPVALVVRCVNVLGILRGVVHNTLFL